MVCNIRYNIVYVYIPYYTHIHILMHIFLNASGYTFISCELYFGLWEYLPLIFVEYLFLEKMSSTITMPALEISAFL